METINIIQCPHCKALIDPWDFMDNGDMEGEFSIECENCNEEFNVSFITDVKFTTSKQ